MFKFNICYDTLKVVDAVNRSNGAYTVDAWSKRKTYRTRRFTVKHVRKLLTYIQFLHSHGRAFTITAHAHGRLEMQWDAIPLALDYHQLPVDHYDDLPAALLGVPTIVDVERYNESVWIDQIPQRTIWNLHNESRVPDKPGGERAP